MADSAIRFSGKLLRPKLDSGQEAWAFIHLPPAASERLSSRGQVAVELLLNGVSRLTVLQPDGIGGHWLKVDSDLMEAAGITVGDEVLIEVTPSKVWPEPEVPQELKRALHDSPTALLVWNDITAAARTDWVFWIESAKKEETRLKRIMGACDMLANGKRRVCCFDRSGIYSKSLSCPVADPLNS